MIRHAERDDYCKEEHSRLGRVSRLELTRTAALSSSPTTLRFVEG